MNINNHQSVIGNHYISKKNIFIYTRGRRVDSLVQRMTLGKLKTSNRIEKPTTMDSTSSSSSVLSAVSGNYPIVRRRISKACNYCRQRKIKCNGNTPCLNCKNHQIECTYSKTIRKKKKQTTKKLTLQDLEKRMNKMDQKFDLLNEQLSTVLNILADNKLGLKNHGSKSNKVKQEQIDESASITSSDEDEEDNYEDEELEDDEDILDEHPDEAYEEQEDHDEFIHQQQPQLPQHNYLSPLSNSSHSESVSSNDSNDFNYNYVDSSANGLNNFNTQGFDASIVPTLGGSYTLDNAYDNMNLGNMGTVTSSNGNGAFEFNNLDSKLNGYLYSEVPIVLNGSQLDNNDHAFS